MQLAFAHLFIYGPLTLLAASPGVVALFVRRPRLGWFQILIAVIVTFPLSIYLDRLETAELTANGYIADSLFFIFRPWVHAIPFGLISVVVMAVISPLLPEPLKRQREVADESSVHVAPWLEEMRREKEK